MDRALFVYERAFIESFSFMNRLNCLDFSRVENRPFFLVWHQQVTYVHTVFEFGRLLYCLEPWTDPHNYHKVQWMTVADQSRTAYICQGIQVTGKTMRNNQLILVLRGFCNL